MDDGAKSDYQASPVVSDVKPVAAQTAKDKKGESNVDPNTYVGKENDPYDGKTQAEVESEAHNPDGSLPPVYDVNTPGMDVNDLADLLEHLGVITSEQRLSAVDPVPGRTVHIKDRFKHRFDPEWKNTHPASEFARKKIPSAG